MNDTLDFTALCRAFKKLLLLNGIFLLLMSVWRAVFFFYYGDLPALAGLYAYVLKAFFLGLRFDLTVVAYLNTVVTLALLVLWAVHSKKVFRKAMSALGYYYALLYSLVFIVLTVDFGFYSYFQNHLNILIFGVLEDDTKALFSTIYENYPIALVAAGYLALLGLIFFLCRSFTRKAAAAVEGEVRPHRVWRKAAFVALLLVGNTLAARGTLALFPLGVMDAAISPDIFINKLSLNGIHTLADAVDFRMKEKKGFDLIKVSGYENDLPQAFADYLGRNRNETDTKGLAALLLKKTKKNAAAERLRPNVVVVVMESFSTDLSLFDSQRFNVLGELGKHFAQDYLFRNFLSGDVGTIGSLETIMLNIPKRPQTTPVCQSAYAYGDHPTAAALPYKRAGYETVFMYGGNTSWRNMDEFAPRLGFASVEGQGAMDPSYPANQWGVYDEYLFDHVYRRLSQNDGKPKFILVMTTTNHPPYSLPRSYTPLPLEFPQELEKLITGDRELARQHFLTYQYSNQKMGEFMSRIKASALGTNTVVAVTGDHNFWGVFTYGADRYLDRYSVPLYLYVPEALRPRKADLTAFGSHLDILPTLYNLTLSDKEYLALGNDLFDASLPHYAFNSEGMLFSGDAAVKYTIDKGHAEFYAPDPLRERRIGSAAENEGHRRLLKYYRAALAVTDYVVKNSGKQEK